MDVRIGNCAVILYFGSHHDLCFGDIQVVFVFDDISYYHWPLFLSVLCPGLAVTIANPWLHLAVSVALSARPALHCTLCCCLLHIVDREVDGTLVNRVLSFLEVILYP